MAKELEILRQSDNKLLHRKEVSFMIKHGGESAPKRSEVKELLAAAIKAKKQNVVIDHLKPTFGKAETHGYAKVYDTIEELRKVEPDHILKRNNVEAPKKPEAQEAKKTEEAPEPAAE